MKIAVFGAGQVGRAAVYFFSRIDNVTGIVLVDRDAGAAESTAKRFGGDKTRSMAVDVSDTGAVADVLSDCDVALGAVSYRVNEAMTRVCIDTKTHWVDLGGNNDVVAAQFEMSGEAAAAGIAIVPDCGLAPGLVSILAARGLELLPGAESVHLRVGGLPRDPKPPFNYQIVFSPEGLINEYVEPTVCLVDGEIVTRPTLGDLETIRFPAPFGELEAFNTSGGASTLPETLRGRVKNLDYKTIRYPGHRDLIQAVFALGLASEQPEEVDGVKIVPRKLLEQRLASSLDFREPDVILASVEVSGKGELIRFRIIDHADQDTGLSAMARCTAFPAAIIACQLGDGVIGERGTLHQELSVPAAKFIETLKSWGIKLIEERGQWE